MEYLSTNTYGLIHLISSIIALLTGTVVLIMKKGTKQHRQIGYMYVASMGILILTAFMIYRLFNGWGIFHYTTLMILLTIGLGMIPIWIKKPIGKWRYMHFSFMYWSVMGLYAAFAAEVLTRIRETLFLGMVAISFGVIMLAGGVIFRMNKSKWSKLFAIKK